jgi:AraC-like DNA-binding protein
MKANEHSLIMPGKDVAEWRKRITDLLIRRKLYRDIDYSASMMAKDLGLSPSALSRLLRSAMGCCYADLVNSHRVKDARKMLANNKYQRYTVDEIGLMVGFRNRQSFFTAFAKHVSTTPQKFRDENRKIDQTINP